MAICIATCGPTGIGKTYQMRRHIERDPQLFTPVLSVTTRPSRGAEDEMWYRFVSREEVGRFDPSDVVSDAEFRGERYLLLRSEIHRALQRAPVAYMAIIPSVIERMRAEGIAHSLINCRVSDIETYRKRLRQRGYTGQRLEDEVWAGLHFPFPPLHPEWPQHDLAMGGTDASDDASFDAAVRGFVSLPASFLMHDVCL